MSFRKLFFVPFVLFAALLAGCKEEDNGTNRIVATNSPQTINEQGIASLTFNVVWQWKMSGNLPASGMTVNFKTTNGSCTSSAVTDSQGNVTCVFTANDPYTFDGATVTASMKHLLNTGGVGTEEMGGVITAEAVVLPLLRPSKSKVKPKITRVGDPPVVEDGKTVFRVRLTESEDGTVYDVPLPGREIRFETDQSKGSCTEKAITDENGEAGCEYKSNDPDNFEGADVIAKASVKYSDGSVDVEEKITVAKPDEITYRLTPTESPQKALRLGNDCIFLLEKVTNGNAAPLGGAAVTFTAENGTIAGGYAEGTTTADGLVRTYFTTDDIINFEGGKVLASATVEGEQVQGTLEIEPADVYVKLIWSSSENRPRYEDGQASFMLDISLILNEKGQEVALSNGGGGTIKADTDGNGAIISIKDTGQSGGASQSGTGATSLQYDFKLGLLDIGYSIDKQ
ncbi:MAG: Ig-like domain-containing protein, partial [Bacteroidales bacterium]|nr:Ig-like domain-containing protein [Bacteroidales bacterium]